MIAALLGHLSTLQLPATQYCTAAQLLNAVRDSCVCVCAHVCRDGPYNLTYQPTAALPRDEWIVTVAARHSNGDSAAAQWKTAIATGAPLSQQSGPHASAA